MPEGKTAKNRVNLDVRAAPGLDGEARMAALEAEKYLAHMPDDAPAVQAWT